MGVAIHILDMRQLDIGGRYCTHNMISLCTHMIAELRHGRNAHEWTIVNHSRHSMKFCERSHTVQAGLMEDKMARACKRQHLKQNS